MPPALLFDLSAIDLNKIVFDKKAIMEINPQAYEMQQLDGVIWYDKQKQLILGFKDVTQNEFWVRGHIPGRPIMPGVIMIEAAAQLTSFFVKKLYEFEGFVGFSGIEDTQFRATVPPGNRLYLLAQAISYNRRKFTCAVQGVANAAMVFNTVISGMKV